MASIEEAVATMLTTRASVSLHIGTRAYDTELPAADDPASSYPACVFQVVHRGDEPHFTGYCPEFASEVQIDTYARTQKERREVAAAVRAAMETFSGAWGGIVVRRAFKVSDFDRRESRDDGGPASAFVNTQRWTVWTRQAPVVVT